MDCLWRLLTRTGAGTHDRRVRPDECVFCAIAAGHAVDGRVAVLLHQDETVFAFADRAPAAAVHILVCPREHIVSARHLQPGSVDDVELASRMLAVGRALVEKAAPGAATRFGYHLPPFNSVDHLHLHAFALPFSPAWKAVKYSDALGALWWLPKATLLRRLGAARSGASGGSYGALDDAA